MNMVSSMTVRNLEINVVYCVGRIEIKIVDKNRLTKGQCSKRQAMLSVLHRPFYISIFISSLPTQPTTFISNSSHFTKFISFLGCLGKTNRYYSSRPGCDVIRSGKTSTHTRIAGETPCRNHYNSQRSSYLSVLPNV